MEIYIQKIVTVSPKKLLGKNCAEIHFAGTNLQIPFLSKSNNSILDNKFAVKLKEIKEEILTIRKNTKTIIIKSGEPCLQRLALKYLCKFIKEKGMFVALETYGTKSNVIKNLLEEKLVDIIILKLFFPIQEKWMNKINKGTLLINSSDIISNIKNSINIIRKHNIKTHVLTKVVPSFIYRTSDFNKIGTLIKDLNNLIWEINTLSYEDLNENSLKLKEANSDFVEEIKSHLIKEFPMINVR
jgi:pyruvate formate lyase activating enzyme